MLSGRISLTTHPWLADHAVQGNVLVPGTAFIDLALRAGDTLGVGELDELVFETPLILPERGAVALQVTVAAPDDAGRRPVSIHSRPQREDEPDGGWIRHASGIFAAADNEGTAEPEALTAWPPPGAEQVPVEGVYDALAASGLAYGPTFQGLRAAWRDGDDLYAEVTLPDTETDQAGAFGVHPALLDAALHAAALSRLPDVPAGHSRLPFAWNGVRLHATGPTTLRVHLTIHGTDEISLRAADATGAPVITVDSLLARVVSAAQLAASRAGGQDSLYQLSWPRLTLVDTAPVPSRWAVIGAGTASTADIAGTADIAATLTGPGGGGGGGAVAEHPNLASLGAAVEAGEDAPDVVVVTVGPAPTGRPATDRPDQDSQDDHDSQDVAGAARALTAQVVELLRSFVSDARLEASRLAVVTSNAVSVGGEAPELRAAGLWGLLRTAQAEYPGRIVLVDTDHDPGSTGVLPAVVATALATGEHQAALRGGTAHAPRLVTATPTATPTPATATGTGTGTGTGTTDPTNPADAGPWNLDPDGTVLVTGGLGALAGHLARHLVTRHHVRHLLLTSRQGPGHPRAEALRGELEELGATVTITATDTAEADAVARLIATVPPEHPLTAVIHTAGTSDDAALVNLTPERLESVLIPKIDGAWNLHRLTREHPLRAFVLYSSVAGIAGGPGQGSYTAANSFLDALAQHRRAEGLPATSLAWGLWEDASAFTEQLSAADRRRIGQSGLRPLSAADGLTLFDAAGRLDQPLVIPAALDLAPVRTRAATGDQPVPPLLRELVRPARRGAARGGAAGGGDGAAVRGRLAAAPAEERESILLEYVRREVANVLGHQDADAVGPERDLGELGLDSLTAVELRNRLNAATGLRLPATLTFDHPTPAAIAAFVAEQFATVPAPANGTSAAAEVRAVGPREGPLSELYLALCAQDQFAAAAQLLVVASYLRPTFDAAASERHTVPTLQLAEGPARHILICLPAMSAISGPHEYARLGTLLRGERDVFVLPSPGYAESDHLPVDEPTYIGMHVREVVRIVEDRPFVLVGRSMGGVAAHAVAAELENAGIAPSGLVLVDSYPPESAVREGMADWWLTAMITGMIERVARYQMVWSDASLTTMGAYVKIFHGWQPKPVATPTILIRAADPLKRTIIDPDDPTGWQAYWPTPHEAVDVPGEHFSVLEEHSPTTLEAIRRFLDSLD
ncbi:type I polyketide synthase [Frankia sp. Mgl5]|nr:type I polyketide synthase [Frankia sp. Mgl5]